LRALWWYNQETLTSLLNKIAEMADNPDFPPNYDFCVSVLSSDFPLLHLIPELDGVMKREHPEIFGYDGLPDWPPAIIVYAQWAPLAPNDKYDPQWFEDLKNAGKWRLKCDEFKDMPLSQLTGEWIFRNIREFDHPYVKRTYLTNSTTLGKDGWVGKVCERIEKVIAPSLRDTYLQCWLSCQIQCFGGNKSRFRIGGESGSTSYSWRDSTVCATIDCFVESSYKHVAEEWQAENDKILLGPEGCFSRQDKRVLWGSYGDWDMSKNWQYYYEDEGKYERLQKARLKADPDGTFTPNPFAVKRFGT